jgi:superfamily II DNA or RNA helicase
MASLRPYQQEAIEAVVAARRAGVRRMVVSLPTGAGKTVIFSALARMAKRPVLVLAHRDELVQQARDKLQTALGESQTVAVEQADVRAPASAKVVVASIRSLHARRLDRLLAERDFGLVVYDECHHAVADDNQRVLRRLGCFERDWAGTLLGFTATVERADGQGLDQVFERIVFHRTLPDLIDAGYLAPLRGFRVTTAADLRSLSAGSLDFADDELAEVVDIEERNALVARSIQELARDRRTVVFCVTVNHALNLARALRLVGVSAGLVHGELPGEDRRRVLADFREGRLQALTNVGVLTEGFDDPGVSCVAMARPTRSAGLYAQCVGRGTRLHPGKTDCLVLDFADVSHLPLVTLPTLFGLPTGFDLQGDDASEARRAVYRALEDAPGLLLEAGAITLAEVQRRAEHFDPLTLQVDPEVKAVSQLAWESLGRAGLALHLEPRAGTLSEVLVLRQGRRWRVRWDDRERAHFGTLEEAVMAVEFEVEQRGRAVLASALPDAPWRRRPVAAALSEAAAVVRRGRLAAPIATQGAAVQLLAFARQVVPS